MDERVEFFDRCIRAFNGRDKDEFARFFHLPVSFVPAPLYERPGAEPLLSGPEPLWAGFLPEGASAAPGRAAASVSSWWRSQPGPPAARRTGTA